jgi:hypothetical protein
MSSPEEMTHFWPTVLHVRLWMAAKSQATGNEAKDDPKEYGRSMTPERRVEIDTLTV